VCNDRAEKLYEEYNQFRAVIKHDGRVHWEPAGACTNLFPSSNRISVLNSFADHTLQMIEKKLGGYCASASIGIHKVLVISDVVSKLKEF